VTTVFLKLGGSLITDKRQRYAFLEDAMNRLALEISDALDANSEMRLLIGHGSGSFGHYEATLHGTAAGVFSPAQWRGFSDVAAAASALSAAVFASLRTAGIPVIRLQPSASVIASGGQVADYALEPILRALEAGLVPLIHGDVAFDRIQGGAILSTEALFFFLTPLLKPDVIILFGDMPGVLDLQGKVISRITPDTMAEVEPALGGSSGTDVTGGMLTKVRDMVTLVQENPATRVLICSGGEPGLLGSVLENPNKLTAGTWISAR